MESSLFPIMGMITWIFWELSLASKENRLIAVSREVHNFILTSLHSIPGKIFFIVLIAQERNGCLQLKAAKKTFAHEIEAICAT